MADQNIDHYFISDPRKLPDDIREIYPTYFVPALRKSLSESRRNVEALHAAVDQEEEKIAELRRLIRLCIARDVELKERGITDL